MSDARISIDPKIRFLISIPDWRPEDATPFQGFAPSLCQKSGMLRFVQQMPTDIFELTPEFLSYLHLGRPETILINTRENVEAALSRQEE